MTCCTNKAREIQEEEDKKPADSMRVYDPETDACYNVVDGKLVVESSAEDYDLCADCPRCKRKKFLGHRYPHYAGHHDHGEVDDELGDHGESERFSSSSEEEDTPW